MSTGIVLDQQATAEVLTGNPSVRDPDWLAADLARQGYALVAVSGVALHAAAERGDLASLPPAAPDQARRIEQWCAPERVS